MPMGFDFTNDVLAKALDGHWARHEAISSNLANVETPGYKRKHVHFESKLSKAIAQHRSNRESQGVTGEQLAMKGSHPSHAQIGATASSVSEIEPTLIVDENYTTRPDDNGVDVEVEMVTLAQNTEHYLALSNIQGRLLRSAKGVLHDIT